jgi:hypothetical protein
LGIISSFIYNQMVRRKKVNHLIDFFFTIQNIVTIFLYFRYFFSNTYLFTFIICLEEIFCFLIKIKCILFINQTFSQ